MAVTRRDSLPVGHLWLRIAVTMAALAAYRLGAHVPLPGISQAAEFLLSGSAASIERLSVFCLGVWPIVTAMMLVELARLLSPGVDEWIGGNWIDGERSGLITLCGALFYSAIQGLSVADALASMPNATFATGLQFRITTTSTIVAGTAVMWWLALLITRNGIGNGVWVLFISPYLVELPGLLGGVSDAVGVGFALESSARIVIACLLVTVAITAWFGCVLAASAMPIDRMLIWPSLIGTFAGTILAVASGWLPAGAIGDMGSLHLARGAPLHAALSAAAVFAVSLAYWKLARPGGAGGSLAVLAALIVTVVVMVPEVLAARLNLPMLIEGSSAMVLVAIVLSLRARTSR